MCRPFIADACFTWTCHLQPHVFLKKLTHYPLAPWPIATVPSKFTKLGCLSDAAPGEAFRAREAAPGDCVQGSQNCLELWDPEPHMTKAVRDPLFCWSGVSRKR